MSRKVAVNEQNLKDVANAIREATGSDEKYLPKEMADGVTEVYEAGRKSLEDELLNGAW